MAKESTRPKFLDVAEEEAERICSARSAGSPGGTCWNGEGTVRRKQPFLMGEGSGFDLICFGSDKTTSRGVSPKERAKREYLAQLERKLAKKSLVRTRSPKQAAAELQRSLKRRVAEGRSPVGFRVFVISWPKKKWEERMKAAGGMPEGVDIAHTEFGNLLLVPVNEVSGADGEPAEPMVDREGRKFWIPFEQMETLKRIFGYVKWKEPLTLAEVKRFGVKLSV